MESVLTAIDDPVLYLYGFVTSDAVVPPLEGIEPGSQVFLVSSGELSCAASVVSARLYDQHHDRNPVEQAEWITRRAWRHHEILGLLHASSTVLPLKFGAICASADAVEQLLRDVQDTVANLLQTFDGKDEWTLRLRADESRLAEEVQNTSPELIALQESAAGLGEGQAYFIRKRLRTKTADAVAARLGTLEDAVYRRLSASGIELSPLQPKDAGDEAPPPFASAALLVERDKRDALKALLETLETEYESCALTFEIVGPWAPYSFASRIDVSHDCVTL